MGLADCVKWVRVSTAREQTRRLPGWGQLEYADKERFSILGPGDVHLFVSTMQEKTPSTVVSLISSANKREKGTTRSRIRCEREDCSNMF
jgi:hypothetical protein